MLPCQRDQVGTVQRSHLLERLTEMGLDRVLGQEDSTPNLSVRQPEDYEAGYLYFPRRQLLARTRHRVNPQALEQVLTVAPRDETSAGVNASLLEHAPGIRLYRVQIGRAACRERVCQYG